MGEYYQVLGTDVPPLLGRDQIIKLLENRLLKKTPDHVCVVGPSRYGKSVILNHLAQAYCYGNSHYIAAMYLDLRHSTPKTDEEFKGILVAQLKNTLLNVNSEVAEYLDLSEEISLYELLESVFEELDQNGKRVLFVLDGFDHVLTADGITRNLWDQLRALAQYNSLRLVTGSRMHLQELRNYMPEDSQVSDFWEIFNPVPISVGKFDDADWLSFLAPLAAKNISLDSSAQKEISNWTGEVPILAAALLSEIYQRTADGKELSKADIDEIAEPMVSSHHLILEALWGDCAEDMKSDLARISSEDVLITTVPGSRKEELEKRGFARQSSNRLKSCCRLIKKYAELRGPSVEEVRRLFQDDQGFEANIQKVLEMRLAQINRGDEQLKGSVSKAIKEICSDPNEAITWMRRIASRALDLIWASELPPDRQLPETWVSEWRIKYPNFPNNNGKLPSGMHHQCTILQLITGSRQNLVPISKYVTKPTCTLLNHIKEVGDFGQHPTEKDEVTIGIAAAYCLSAISLCESLSNDLP